MNDVTLTLITAGSCAHREAITRRGGSWRTVDFPSLVAVIRHPNHGVILFDTGYTARFGAETAHFPNSVYGRATPVRCPPDETAVAQLGRLGIGAHDVTLVVLSHFHADHVSGLRDFPSAQVVFGRDALAPLQAARGLARVRQGFLPGLLPEDLMDRTRHVEDHPPPTSDVRLSALGPGHDLLGDGTVVAVPLPGHHTGHSGLLVRTTRRDVLLVGDSAWSVAAVERLDLPHPVVRLITHRWGAYRHTLTALHRLQADNPELLVVPSHCPVGIARAQDALAVRL